MSWSMFQDDWGLRDSVSFDGYNRLIRVSPNVTQLNITDVWSAWVDWRGSEYRDHHALAMRRSGFDLIPGGRTGATFFLINQWRLVVDLSKVQVRGVLFSDDFPTAYYTGDLSAQYPAEVTSVVNTSVTTQNIVSGDAESIAQATRALLDIPLSEINGMTVTLRDLIANDVLPEAVKARKLQSNRAVISPDDSLVTIYDDDGVTILHQFDVSADKRVRVPV